MYKNILLVISFLLFSSLIFSQNKKLGKVTVDELKEKTHPKDSAASAAILYKKGNTYFQVDPEGYWQVVHEIEVKIKIYKKEGYDFANIEEAYYDGTRGDKVYFSDAVTYNLVNGEIEKSKLKNEGEFKEKNSKYTTIKKISMPNVKEGSIIEYKMTKITYNIVRLSNFYFQFDIPVNYIELSVTHHENYTYNTFLYGYLTPKIEKEIQHITNADYKNFKTKYIFEDVSAMKDEKYVNNINNYRSRIKYELSSKKTKIGEDEYYATDWESVAKKIYEEESFGKELKKDNYFEVDITTLLNGLKNRDEIINIIFTYVKDRMNWDEYYGIFCDKGVKEAYKSKTGNVAEINLMLTSMLRFAGLDANPILISTRSNGVNLFPSRTAFNYVICGVEIENDIIFLDATSKNAIPNILPIRNLNWTGRIIRKEGSSAEVDVMPKINSKDIMNVMATIQEDGKVVGKYRDQYFDYQAFLFREKNADNTKESTISNLEGNYKGIEIDDYKVENIKEYNKPIVEEISFIHTNLVEQIGQYLYFSPILHLGINENPFKLEKREYPVDFVFPKQYKYNISITIPEGYSVESMPEPLNLMMSNNICAFKFNTTSMGNKIQLAINFEINQTIISPEYYKSLQEFFKTMLEKQNEKIVLKKV